MEKVQAPTEEPARAAARRAQILCAAADCFRAHGFHGASIARISAAAGMSAGHIYHYFENKEAIIAAIVEQNEQRVTRIIGSLRDADDLVEAMVEHAAEKVERQLDRDAAALRLEILAEAARNPRIAAIVRAADERIRESALQMLHALRCPHGQRPFSGAETTAAHEVLAAMFEGLTVRGVCNTHLAPSEITPLFRQLIRALFACSCSDPAR